MFCTQCGTNISDHAQFCGGCGRPQTGNAAAVQPGAPAPFGVQRPPEQVTYVNTNNTYIQTQAPKSRITAAVLALLLGGIGVHKFYMGKILPGFLYLVFCWTWIPLVVSFIEAIIYFTQDDRTFAEKQAASSF